MTAHCEPEAMQHENAAIIHSTILSSSRRVHYRVIGVHDTFSV